MPSIPKLFRLGQKHLFPLKCNHKGFYLEIWKTECKINKSKIFVIRKIHKIFFKIVNKKEDFAYILQMLVLLFQIIIIEIEMKKKKRKHFSIF